MSLSVFLYLKEREKDSLMMMIHKIQATLIQMTSFEQKKEEKNPKKDSYCNMFAD